MAANFSLPGQEPLDQTYVAFRDGWEQWILNEPASSGLRWSPKERGWRTYSLSKFDYIDFGVAGPASPLEGEFDFNLKPWGYRFKWKSGLPRLDMPNLWTDINEVYERVRANRPYAVWNPYDGSWREMRWRQSAPTGTGPIRTDPSDELVRRINELYELHRLDKISDQVLQQRILELTREYT